MYFFRREKVQCRYQFSLRDAVDLTLLQRALTTALASAPYTLTLWDRNGVLISETKGTMGSIWR